MAVVVKNPPANAGEAGSTLGQEDPLEVWQPTPAVLRGESHGQRSLAGYSPQGRRESDTTERLSMHARTAMIMDRTV